MKISNLIAKNLFFLSAAEIISKALAVITSAYLGRVLTPNGFGILGFAFAFVSFFILFVNFGFNTYGMREIAKDRAKIKPLVNNILSIRIILAFLTFITLLIIIFFINETYIVKTVLIITGLSLFANAFMINWVFQGIEKMEYLAFGQIIAGIFNLTGVIIFVHSMDDIIIAAIVSFLSALLNALLFLRIYKKLFFQFKYEFNIIYWKYLMKESFPIVVSTFMVAVYYNLDMVMLGYLRNTYEVGIYNAAYKIFLIGILPFNLILMAFYPSLSKIGLKKTKEFSKNIFNYGAMLLSAGLISTIFLTLFAKQIIFLIFGSLYSAAIIPLSILTLNVLVISVNIFFGNPLIAWGKQKEYSIAITAGAITNVILNVLLIPHYSYLGASFATLLSEAAVFLGVFTLFNIYTHRKYVYEI